MTRRAPAGDERAPVTWVVGAGGLLGTAVAATLRRRGAGPVMTWQVSWGTAAAGRDLADGLDRLVELAEQPHTPWRVLWCAGAGVTGTSSAALDLEVATLTDFLAALAARRSAIGGGTVFLASSAGGLYAGGATGRPQSEADEPVPISAYGRAKLAAENAARAYAAATGDTVQIGRIANLYGPGQNLDKGQGLISALCRGSITRQPVSVYVSLDTVRDYLFVDDCAEMIADMVELGRPTEIPAGTALVKVLASQQGTTIASLIAVCRQVFKRAPLIALGRSANAAFQVRDLRLASVVWPAIDRRCLTPLPVGIAATAAGILLATQRATR